jgi:hypothetical protein
VEHTHTLLTFTQPQSTQQNLHRWSFANNRGLG